jgi:hypothetical protein
MCTWYNFLISYSGAVRFLISVNAVTACSPMYTDCLCKYCMHFYVLPNDLVFSRLATGKRKSIGSILSVVLLGGWPERLERGDPCWLLKQRWMGTQRVQMKVVHPCWFAVFRAGTRDFCSALAASVGPVQNILFLTRTLFQFLCLHRPARWAGSRAGSPVSVSYVLSTHYPLPALICTN